MANKRSRKRGGTCDEAKKDQNNCYVENHKDSFSAILFLAEKLIMNRKKVLLMGKSGSGKTSMRCTKLCFYSTSTYVSMLRSIIFANFIARDTRRLGATIDVEHSHVRLLGNLVLNLWDCGGQEAFMENYFASQRDNIFRNVEVNVATSMFRLLIQASGFDIRLRR